MEIKGFSIISGHKGAVLSLEWTQVVVLPFKWSPGDCSIIQVAISGCSMFKVATRWLFYYSSGHKWLFYHLSGHQVTSIIQVANRGLTVLSFCSYSYHSSSKECFHYISFFLFLFLCVGPFPRFLWGVRAPLTGSLVTCLFPTVFFSLFFLISSVTFLIFSCFFLFSSLFIALACLTFHFH